MLQAFYHFYPLHIFVSTYNKPCNNALTWKTSKPFGLRCVQLTGVNLIL